MANKSSNSSSGTCHINDDRSVTHVDKGGFTTRVTHQTTPSGRPTGDFIGWGPNKGNTYFGSKGGCKK